MRHLSSVKYISFLKKVTMKELAISLKHRKRKTLKFARF
ncbi:hypothetical protein CUP0522 [Campylobacter upsaliensis RM3195]|nr:hypothetical protein CUP0522 [Campylobacter upsaliensis RM3195]